MAIPFIPAALVVAGAAVVSVIRPSTAVRLVEDGVIGTGKLVVRGAKRVGQGAKRAAHETKIEYKARALDRARASVQAEAEALRELSPDELRALAEEQARILARAEELRAQREGVSAEPVPPPRKAAKRGARRAK